MSPAGITASTGRWSATCGIGYGLAKANFHPLSLHPEGIPIQDEPQLELAHSHQVPLEVGDEVYVVELFRPRHPRASTSTDTDAEAGVWYRGYVVSTSLLPRRTAHPDTRSEFALAPTTEDPQVSFGVFPASLVHIREHLDENDSRVSEVTAQAEKQEREPRPPRSRGPSKSVSNGRMEPLREEEEEDKHDSVEREAKGGNLASNGHDVTINVIPYHSPSRSKNRASIGSISSFGSQFAPDPQIHPSRLFSGRLPSEVSDLRPYPPLPNLKCGDETARGMKEPLIDEIACALREWAHLLNTHLDRRDYQLFEAVKRRFDTLHAGRMRLLSNMLDLEDARALKSELVTCLAKGNIEQGLDIIVRHPTTGQLIDLDLGAGSTQEDWLSIVRLYATQVALAYNTPLPLLNRPLPLPSVGAPLAFEPSEPISPFCTAPSANPASRLHHISVDYEGLSANIAAPGELVELHFSLFNQSDTRYITEEFCLVLDHNGIPVRPNGVSRIQTLFRNLSQHDVQDQLYLVCRIVKNGGIKPSSAANPTQTPPLSHRSTFMSYSPGPRSETASIADAASMASNGANEASVEHIGSSQEMLVSDPAGRLSCRRPFGCAVLEVSQFNHRQDDDSLPLVMPIFVPVSEASAATLHEDIIASRTKEFEKSAQADRLSVRVRILQGEASELVRDHPQQFANVTFTDRLGFPDVVVPENRRNEVFVKLWSGEFHTSGASMGTTRSLAQFTAASGAKNVEISVELRNRAGEPVHRGLSRGSGESNVTQFTSVVFRSSNTPTWGELVKVEIPLEHAEDHHLYFTFRSRSLSTSSSSQRAADMPFAFAYFPLFANSTTFQPDGSHNLVLYRWDRSVSVPSFYTQGPAIRDSARPLPALPPAVSHDLVPLQDTLIIRSFLVSTYHTQNTTILSLLDWQNTLSQDPALTKQTLSDLMFCSEVEICKFLKEILNALFGLLSSSSELGVHQLAFHALVTILGIVSDRRFTNFKPVLERYITHNFEARSAGLQILQSLIQLLSQPGDVETASQLRSSIKVWRWLFRFVVRTHEQHSKSNDIDQLYRDEVTSFMDALKSLLRTTTPSSIIGTQTLAVQHFSSILPALASFYDPEELAENAIASVDSIGNPKGKMIVWRLLLLNQLVTSPALAPAESRSLILTNLIRYIKPSLGKFEEQILCKPNDSQASKDNKRVSWIEGIRLSVGIVAAMLDSLQEALVDPKVVGSRSLLAQEHDNLEYLLGLLPRLLESYRELQNVANLDAIERQRSQASVAPNALSVFPSTYPVSLLSYSAKYLRHQSTDFNHATLPEKVETWPTLQAGVGEVGAVFVALVLLAPRKVFVNWLESTLEIEGKDTFARQLGQMFRVAQSIIEEEAFPSDWLNITALAHRAVLDIAETAADILESHFVTPASSSFAFNTALWRDFFGMLFKLLTSEHLLIEEFSPQKRRAVWRLTSDIRSRGSKVLKRLWNAIAAQQDRKPLRYGLYQVQFVPTFIDDVLTLCMSRHDELRQTAVEILYSMVLSEYHLNSPPQFGTIEKQVIERFDRLFGVDTKGDELSRASFVDQLADLFASSDMEDDLKLQVERFLSSVASFLDLLFAVRSLPIGEEYQEDRIISTLKLMSFIRSIGRTEIFVRYVQRLVTYHVALGNEVEAGLTLKLHADLHEWNTSKTLEAIPELDLPRQTEFARKETLYTRILDHLGKGKAWEVALGLCKEQQQEYEANTFNYVRLSALLSLQAQLYASIASSERHFGKYFRVAFYGQWPAPVAGKQFVYRGRPFETSGEFVDRMLNKYPGAQILRTNTIPEDDVRYGETQYLQVTGVAPEPDLSSPVFTDPTIPRYIRAYYEENNVNTFAFVSALETSTDVSNDPALRWTEKTVLICEESFPTILRRSEIVEIRLIELSPIENAVQDLKSQTDELSGIWRRYTASFQSEADVREIDSNPLSMALNNAVDPPSDHGAPHYRDLFLRSDAVAAVPTSQHSIVRQLEDAMTEYVVTIARCLELNARLCDPEMQSFHKTLEGFFEKNYHEEIFRLPVGTYEPASFIQPEQLTPETSLDLPRDSSPTSNGLLISTQDPVHNVSTVATKVVDRPRLGSISGASLNTNASRRPTSAYVPERTQSPTKSLRGTVSSTMLATGSGKENGNGSQLQHHLRLSSSSPTLSQSGQLVEDNTSAKTATVTNTTTTGVKRTSIFGNLKKGLGKRKGSVATLAEE
ncbi:guanine nucleotide exchange factor DCK1 [Sporobolomyces koalae]|uniref:guanine nucleotide exchange factor DCK1 n=1 Tax=Sporobolomyces koalae TaxID=500713 RepID=UPI003179B61D